MSRSAKANKARKPHTGGMSGKFESNRWGNSIVNMYLGFFRFADFNYHEVK